MLIAANWKLHKTPRESEEFCDKLLSLNWPTELSVALFPSALCSGAVSSVLSRATKAKLQWGPQQVSTEVQGAFTGENSARVAAAMGATFCLIGHSERRTLFHESDLDVRRKVAVALEQSLRPLLCVGETLTERTENRTTQRLTEQLQAALKDLDSTDKLVVAYEPVWAIGTGLVASEAQVGEAHQTIRRQLSALGFPKSVPILYGGSVKAESAGGLARTAEVGGFLVGGASLAVESFYAIIQASASALGLQR